MFLISSSGTSGLLFHMKGVLNGVDTMTDDSNADLSLQTHFFCGDPGLPCMNKHNLLTSDSLIFCGMLPFIFLFIKLFPPKLLYSHPFCTASCV